MRILRPNFFQSTSTADKRRPDNFTGAADNPLRFPTERIKPPLVLKRGHIYSHAELSFDKQHRYCDRCDIFWSVGYDHHHFVEDCFPKVRS
jgi:hypothetical protein